MAKRTCGADGCGRPSHAKSYCTKHYQRLMKTGSVVRHVPTTEERFWSHVDRTGECWVWTAAKAFHEYGAFNVGGTMVLTHRFSYELHHGPIVNGEWVLHHCDNPPCVRPEHLYLGDAKDNARDRVERNRTPRGSGHASHKLTEDDVRDIRRMAEEGTYRRVIAERFGVTETNIDQVVWRKTWRHVA